MPNLVESSRENYRTRDPVPTESELRVGALQRIASATERMARSHEELEQDRDRWKRWHDAERDQRRRGDRRIAALKGVVTRLQRKLAASRATQLAASPAGEVTS